MRMEELANNNFIKGTDSVERYLLDIIKQYFSSNDIDDDSREYIIKRAVEQMKTELNIDNAGVVSVNGQTGEVNITLDSLGGEPLISPKQSAFNVNFGSEQNTACMGNDPRLSDKRQPLAHEHTISEINGLQGELSSIENVINMLSNETHKHDNLKLLSMFKYTGNNPEINLDILGNSEERINTEINKVDEVILDTELKTNKLIELTTDELKQYDDDYNNIKTYIDDKNTELETKIITYCDTNVSNLQQSIDEELKNKISKIQMNTIIDALNQQFNILHEESIANFITSNDSNVMLETTLPVEITETLTSLNNNNYKVSFTITYNDPSNGKLVITNLPFIYTENNKLLYTIKGELIDKSIIRITSNKEINSIWPAFIDSAVIRIKVSIKNNLVEV